MRGSYREGFIRGGGGGGIRDVPNFTFCLILWMIYWSVSTDGGHSETECGDE